MILITSSMLSCAIFKPSKRGPTIPRFFQVGVPLCWRMTSTWNSTERSQGFLERHNLRLTVMEREHNHADGILQLAHKLDSLIQRHLRIGFLFQIDDDNDIPLSCPIRRSERISCQSFYLFTSSAIFSINRALLTI